MFSRRGFSLMLIWKYITKPNLFCEKKAVIFMKVKDRPIVETFIAACDIFLDSVNKSSVEEKDLNVRPVRKPDMYQSEGYLLENYWST